MKEGKLDPIAVVKGGKSTKFDDFMKNARRARRHDGVGRGSGRSRRRRDEAGSSEEVSA